MRARLRSLIDLPLHSALAAAALVVVMALGLWQVAAALSQPEIREVPVDAHDIRTGRSASVLERKVEALLPWRDRMVTAASVLRYMLMRGAGPDVRAGREGWLFLSEELRFNPGADASTEARIALVERASRELRARGIALVVALVPDKARLYGEYLPRGPASAYDRARYERALRSLRAKDVDVVDLFTPLAQAAQASEVYYRTDTHWNQRGAQVAARAIAEAIGQRGIALAPATFREVSAPERERAGDLIRLMGLEHAPALLRPKPDREAPITTEEVTASSGSALFGDATIPVVLLGTSYSMRANFHGFLQEALGAGVLNAARDGAGFLQSVNDYLGNDAYRDAPPQVIVWELPERFLPLPLEGGLALALDKRER